ncbi:MAG: hypothetical protein NTX08_02205 [Sphingobacteriales bacterium]|nr:hypothetical protein [Sphingobacteriales bacterium]
MKNLWILLMLGSIAFIQVSCNSNSDKIIGEWAGVYNGIQTKMIFDKYNNIIIVDGNKVLGGSDFMINGVKAELTYELNYTKSPVWLDVIGHDKDHLKKDSRFKGIIKFLSDTKIQYRMNFRADGDRPANFNYSDNANTIVLDKVIK